MIELRERHNPRAAVNNFDLAVLPTIALYIRDKTLGNKTPNTVTVVYHFIGIIVGDYILIPWFQLVLPSINPGDYASSPPPPAFYFKFSRAFDVLHGFRSDPQHPLTQPTKTSCNARQTRQTATAAQKTRTPIQHHY